MKYAICGPQGQINRITETAPINPLGVVHEITDEQAVLIEAGKLATPKQFYVFINDELKTQQEAIEIRRVQREQERFAALPLEEQQLILAKKAAWEASATAFESMPLGKQALWEPVRAKVAAFIKAGEFNLAYQTIATVPDLYEGMDVDRNMFLSLFA